MKVEVNCESASQELTKTDQNGAKITITRPKHCPFDHLTDHMMNIHTIKATVSRYTVETRETIIKTTLFISTLDTTTKFVIMTI